MNRPPAPQYSSKLLQERLEYLKSLKGEFFFSNQYGMHFILNEEGGIVLNLTALVKEEDRVD